MTTVVEADTVIVGSGVAGMTVAARLLERDRPVSVIERGSSVPWRRQLETGTWEGDGGGSEHNHENDSDGEDWPWNYVYSVGGSCNKWAGMAPRLLPEDFEMASRFGVMRDWPVSYDDLLPHYRRVERLMGVAGPQGSELFPGAPYFQPPHPLSPGDRLVAPLLEPFVALPQARPSRPLGDRPACCGSARCQLCPVDSRFSVLNGMGDTLRHGKLDLRADTVAARLVSDRAGTRVEALECIGADGSRMTIRGERFVVAANGIESAGLLLRSGITTRETGRNLYDHANASITMTIARPSGAGHGSALATGATYRYYTGDFRRERAAALLNVENLGAMYDVAGLTVDGLLNGRSGRRLRREVADRYTRTLNFDIYMDDVSNPDNRVELSSRKDRFGLPLNRVRYRRATPYLERGLRHVLDDLPRALRPLGVKSSIFSYAPQGAHMIGTLRMGDDDGAVVDRDGRHRLRENLFVAGSAVFPTASPANPTLTLAALADRLGEVLAA